jgi:hypothetical protein
MKKFHYTMIDCETGQKTEHTAFEPETKEELQELLSESIEKDLVQKSFLTREFYLKYQKQFRFAEKTDDLQVSCGCGRNMGRMSLKQATLYSCTTCRDCKDDHNGEY